MAAAHMLDLALAAVAFLGHFSLAVWLFNRLHALPWPRKRIGRLEKLLLATAAGALVAYAWRWWTSGTIVWSGEAIAAGDWPWLVYAALCSVAGLVAVPLWLVPKLCERTPAALVEWQVECVDIARKLGFRPTGKPATRIAAAIPGNEILQLQIARKTLALPQLPAALEGLTIAHLSDLHMTGKLTQPFYDEVVDQTLALDADLIVITGDIAECEQCLPWIEPTLGRLRARLGVYFVLGNHEKRLKDVQPLRRTLEESGIVDMGSRSRWIDDGPAKLFLSGIELPWFGSRPPLDELPRASREDAFSILLSHTPDQYPWARRQGFDLMLAGHNHGGQIRLPLLGALITPSCYGSRYAGGLYHEPPTLLHVSRGIAGLHSVRFNCLPELALLTLVGQPAAVKCARGAAMAATAPTDPASPEAA